VKRKIIKIDEEKCNGCGQCVNACPEGAIKMINGKAKLVSDFYCDGLGACIGHCPVDAITIEEREAQDYSEAKAMENIVKSGKEAIVSHIKHLEEHNQKEYLKEAVEYLKNKKIKIDMEKNAHSAHSGCPGSKMLFFKETAGETVQPSISGKSELRQWPIQLHLVNPSAPYFKDADIVVAADCVPFSYPNFHDRFLKGKALVIFCPKLDSELDLYVEKLSEIFSINGIKSITLLHMEVPCCFGLVNIIEEALKKSGKNIIVKEYTISIRGEIL
jgi:NAD-dependent dihydropyrimidine dehydrogenase PreA subunit